MKFHDFSPFYRSSEGIKDKVSGDRLLDNPLVADVQSGASYRFDGTDDSVDLGTFTSIDQGNRTATFWVKSSMADNDYTYLADIEGSGGKRVIYAWNGDVAGKLSMRCNNGSANSWVSFGSAPNDGEWHHLAFIADGTSVSCYVDGVQSSATGTQVSPITFTPTHARIASYMSGGGSHFDGEIRQVRLHNRALSADEVRAAYSGQAVSYEYRDDGLSGYGVNVERIPSASNRTFASGIGNWSAVSITPTNDSSALKFTQTAAYSVSAPIGSMTFGERGYLSSVYFADFQIGRRYRLTFDAKATTAGSKLYSSIQGNGAHIAEEAHTLTTSFATYNYEFLVPTGCNPTQYFIFALDAAEAYWLDNVSCVQIGCVAEYLPTGINSTQWVDTSGNGLTGTTSTATAVNHEVGSLTMVDNIVMANGKGIDFSATSDATGKTSEVLDDYEEGTWTPVAIGASSNPSAPSTAVGKYTKIGRLVTVDFYVGWPSTGASAGSGNLSISGLPFNSAASGYNAASGVVAYASEWGTGQKGAPSSLYIQADTDDIKVRVADSDIGNKTAYAVSDANAADIQNNTLLAGSMTYRVTD